DGRRERRQRTGAAYDQRLTPLGCVVERPNAAHECASVREIDVVRTGFDTCVRHRIVLCLEGSRSVNDDLRIRSRERFGKRGCVTIDGERFRIAADFSCEALGPFATTSCDEDTMACGIRVGGECRDASPAEIAVSAEYDDRTHSQLRKRSASDALGTRQTSRRPKKR